MLRRIAALLGLGSLACASGGDALPPGFQDAAYAARDDARQHRRYVMHLREEYRAPLMEIIRECRLEHRQETREADIVIRVGVEGEPLETIANPPSPFADCTMSGLRKLTLLPPPKPDHWVRLYIPPCSRGGGPGGCWQMVP